jgi:hypothetical protein
VKRLLLVLLVASAGYSAYRYAVVDAPGRSFQAFARAWAREDTPAAVAWTSGEAAKSAAESRILRGVVRAPMEAFRGSRQDLESREAAPDGTVVVTVKQFVFYDPPGVTSGVGGAGVATIRHVARMRKTAEGWRVVEWTPEFLDAKPTRPGR